MHKKLYKKLRDYTSSVDSKARVFFLHLSDRIGYKKWRDYPLGMVRGQKGDYDSRFELGKKQKNLEIEKFENKTNNSIDETFLNDLAYHVQISHKKSYPDFSHGNVLYSALASYLKNTEDKENVTVFETGTAKGFSAICMAKALDDTGVSGKSVTFDILPHDVVMYWNSVNDHLRGPVTRRSLLDKWGDLVDNYVIFIEGDSRLMMNKVHTGRVNFAFLDGGHTYDDVCFEFSCIQDKQRSGDIIICDDYNVVEFPGIVNAVGEMCEIGGYSKDIVSLTGNRKLAVCEKGRD